MKSTLVIFLILLTFHSVRTASAQGCSDAGVCTTGLMSTLMEESTPGPEFNIGFHLARGDDGTTINSIMLEGFYHFSTKTWIQVRIPYRFISGGLAGTNGFGDITVSVNNVFHRKNGHTFGGFLGTRIATGKADLDEDGKPLPMVYQPTLGTTDVLIGMRWSYRGWNASLGYQQPIAQNNENGFLQSLWDEESAGSYHDSRQLKRQADLVARVEKRFVFGSFGFTGGLVPIYHLGQDSYLNENDERVDIEGSEGLTLNLALSADYNLKDMTYFRAFFGSPLVTRDVQPDGLARQYVAGISAGLRL